ncbi:MAG: hypothetical protein MPW15_25415 [Candidatus Manganitrophus sp.]|nr:hypothetical protein [Candidatus Manganitrophus sp.]
MGEQGKHYLSRLMANAGLIERLIADLLAYSRVGRKELNPERIQPDTVVQRVLGKFSKEITEKKDPCGNPLAVAGDFFRYGRSWSSSSRI